MAPRALTMTEIVSVTPRATSAWVKRPATAAALRRVLDVTVRTGPNDNILEFSYFTKGGHKDVFKADDGNGDAWVLKICDERYESITKELMVQGAMADDVPPSDLCASIKPSHNAH